MHDLVVVSAALDVILGRRLGLSPTEYQAMKHLMTSSRALGTVELGDLVGLTSGSATGLVDRLEAAGHVRRHRDPQDRRRLIIEPTPEALSRAGRQLEPLDDSLQELVGHYSDTQRDLIVHFLRDAAERYRAFGEQESQQRR